jgi:hypothetical protein
MVNMKLFSGQWLERSLNIRQASIESKEFPRAK